MKYYSEKVNKLFGSEKEVKDAEAEYDKKIAKRQEEQKQQELAKKKLQDERAARAKEIEDAREDCNRANKVLHDKIQAFVRDYGGYHVTVHSADPFWDMDNDLEHMFKMFFNF